MKNRSIRFKITLWYTLALVIIAGLTLLIIRIAGGVVMRSTIREYLIGVVEENTDEIVFIEDRSGENPTEAAYVHLRYKDGYLRVDDNFMNKVSDVHSSIYTGGGEMLYGENPLALETEGMEFTESRIWSMTKDGMRFNIYDRKLNLDLPSNEAIWIRGIVSEEENVEKLSGITRISLMVLPFLIFAAVLMGYFLSGRMLSPIRDMERTAERITSGRDLGQRLEVGKNNDELSALARVFNRMIARLDGAFDTERRFTSDASHELRTPMSVIMAQSEYTLSKERSAEEYREALEVIQRQGKRMNVLINDMLDYTRMDQGAERYPLEDVDLSAVVLDMADQMGLLRTRKIELLSDIEPDIHVDGNRMLLSRLVQNLVSNAYRYGKENGHIWLELKPVSGGASPGKAVLSVRDDGIGIAEEEREKIFERFYRSDASRSVQGTGLGLAMVRKIADVHGATVELDSVPSEGSTFRVIFNRI